MAIDLSKSATPPPARKTPAAGSGSRPRKLSADSRISEREEAVNGIFQLGAAGCMMIGQHTDAAACAKHGPPISHELATLAESNESIAKIIDYITAVGPYAGLITAVLPFGLQILVNHGRLPAAPLASIGIEDPEVMRAGMERDALQAHLAMVREQESMNAELAELRREAMREANNRQPEPAPA